MIINSSYIDYYDSFSSKWRDQKIVYNREFGILENVPVFHNAWSYADCSNKFSTDSHELFVISIFGNLYQGYSNIMPIIIENNGKIVVIPEQKNGIFDYENAYELYRQSVGVRWYFRSFEKKIQKGYYDKELDVWQKENKIPIVLFTKRKIFKNPKLKDYKFPMNVQEIVQLISGGLMTEEPKIDETDDEYKVISAGFDTTESFRQEKGGPTRKRKKLKL